MNFEDSSMTVLRPPIIKIDGRFYRKNPCIQTSSQDPAPYIEEDEFESEEEEEDAYADEVCDAFTNIEQTDNGYRIALPIPSAYFGVIIGKKGETKRRIESETKVQVRIPRQGHEGDVVITGQERKNVLSAKTRIDVLVDSARQRQPFTHFLSFPVNSKQIKDGFAEFRSDVLRECDGDRGLDGTIFQNPDKLHLTIGTLPLMNDAEIRKALELLKQCQLELVDPLLQWEPLMADFHGLEYMNDDPGAVNVLYAKVQLQDGSQRLQRFADALVDKFVREGLMQKDYDRVKLHVTVMNTLMRKDPSGTSVPQSKGGRPLGKDRESFDARGVLRLFGDYKFGEQRIDEVHLSQRYSTGQDGYYACAGKLDLP